ncbi:MAG: hypothetical protein AAGI38_08620 [Bacteroidota bacterium]
MSPTATRHSYIFFLLVLVGTTCIYWQGCGTDDGEGLAPGFIEGTVDGAVFRTDWRAAGQERFHSAFVQDTAGSFIKIIRQLSEDDLSRWEINITDIELDTLNVPVSIMFPDTFPNKPQPLISYIPVGTGGIAETFISSEIEMILTGKGDDVMTGTFEGKLVSTRDFQTQVNVSMGRFEIPIQRFSE